MKKLVAVLVALVLVAGSMVGGYYIGKSKALSHVYPRTAVVTALEYDTDSVVVTDAVGYVWAFYGIENYEVGDMVSLIMNDNGTETITDDSVVDALYGGEIGFYEVSEG